MELLDRILPFLPAAIFALALGMALFGDEGLNERRGLVTSLRDTEQEILETRSKNATLEEEIRLHQDDEATLERKAREDLGMVRPGDTVYRFVDESK